MLIRIKYGLLILVLLQQILASSIVTAIELNEYPKLRAVADQLVADGHYTMPELVDIFAQAEFQQVVLDAMQNPAEYRFTWGKYRKLFLQEDRIQQGADFWQEYAEPLARAEATYGVPASMIVAIIGVESKFGKYKGKHKVLDSLVTLVVGFERRSKFFASELREFLILTKENNMAADEILGSYAGAVGFPQFISSSYRNYAVDFSGDGVTDLIDQPIDAIGSIANYFVKNGWLKGRPVTSAEHHSVPAQIAERASNKRKVQHSAVTLRALGAPISEEIDDTEKLGVIMLNASEIVLDPKTSDTYLVRAGDTACEIAEKFEVSCRSLFALNKLNKKGAIFRGQRLKIPPNSVAKTKSESAAKTDSKWKVSNANAKSTTVPGDYEGHMPRYFFTHENFYVITRYNQSVLYAMAVNDLSTAIADQRQKFLQSSGGSE
ncbi:MAG: lytic murein transglycosylase [Pseudomonadota bacterium]